MVVKALPKAFLPPQRQGVSGKILSERRYKRELNEGLAHLVDTVHELREHYSADIFFKAMRAFLSRGARANTFALQITIGSTLRIPTWRLDKNPDTKEEMLKVLKFLLENHLSNSASEKTLITYALKWGKDSAYTNDVGRLLQERQKRRMQTRGGS